MTRTAWMAIAVVCILLPAGLYLMQQRPPPPQSMGHLEPWQLIDQNGGAFGSEQLAGAPYVTSFFFTSCPSICPKIMAAMKTVQARTDAGLRLVSITVDPQTDTPPVLLDAQQRYGVDPARWRLVTGTDTQIRKVVVDGFKTYVGNKKARQDDVFDIAHGARLVLVDGDGEVRGHFETDAAGLDRLIAAYKSL